jgi:hypothetical protein
VESAYNYTMSALARAVENRSPKHSQDWSADERVESVVELTLPRHWCSLEQNHLKHLLLINDGLCELGGTLRNNNLASRR